MNLRYIKGKETTLVFSNAELAFALMALSAYVQNSGGRLTGEVARLHAILDDMTLEIKRRVEEERMARRYHLCLKCCKEVDTEVDEYQKFTSTTGTTLYCHQTCPPVNTREGYNA
jgi:hypothetical protein